VTFFSASALIVITIYGLILTRVFLNSKIQPAIGESKEAHTLESEESRVIHEFVPVKSKKIDKREKYSPSPTAVDRSSIEMPIKITHEELCDKKLTWDNLPDDDS